MYSRSFDASQSKPMVGVVQNALKTSLILQLCVMFRLSRVEQFEEDHDPNKILVEVVNYAFRKSDDTLQILDI